MPRIRVAGPEETRVELRITCSLRLLLLFMKKISAGDSPTYFTQPPCRLPSCNSAVKERERTANVCGRARASKCSTFFFSLPSRVVDLEKKPRDSAATYQQAGRDLLRLTNGRTDGRRKDGRRQSEELPRELPRELFNADFAARISPR